MRRVHFNSPPVQELFGIKIKLVGRKKKKKEIKKEEGCFFLQCVCKMSWLQKAVFLIVYEMQQFISVTVYL